jgi:23S rRNA-/tRNA-specific pseudouridylate synthase
MRWVVRPGDGTTVRDVLARSGVDVQAVRDGRVFVGRRRVRFDEEPVREGDELSVAVPRQAFAGRVRLLVREGDLVAADKPAGVPTIADHEGAAHSLVALVARETGLDPSRVHPTSRLDRDVSGVVFFALTKEAARRLAQARVEGRYERRYVGVASRFPGAREHGTWNAPIGRARDPRLRTVGGRDATHAETLYAVLARAAGGPALLAVRPLTGRTHQIRVHAAHAGAPLLGDRSYGGPARVTLPNGTVLETDRIALHAARVVVPGERGVPLVATAPVPGSMRGLWSSLGGDDHAWEVAASCALDGS